MQGVDRIDDDLMTILTAEGLYDRKAVVVWPTSDFLAMPPDPNDLTEACNMKLVDLTAVIEQDLLFPKYTVEDYHRLVEQVRQDSTAMASALQISARSQAYALLSRLVLAITGGQNLVVVVSKSTPKNHMRWLTFPEYWSDGDCKEVKNYTSSEPGYGALNAVGKFPLMYHGIKPGCMQAGDLVPRKTFSLDGDKVYYDANSYLGAEQALTASVELSFPVSDRFSGARAIKVSADDSYMLVVPEPDKIRNFIIGLKTAPKPKSKVEETAAIPKSTKAKTDEYMTRKDVAEMLKATTRTVDRYIDDGKLESTKVGGKVLILKSSVDKLVEG